MIKLGKTGVDLICASCGFEIKGFHDADEANSYKASEDWKEVFYKGKREDICPGCRGGKR